MRKIILDKRNREFYDAGIMKITKNTILLLTLLSLVFLLGACGQNTKNAIETESPEAYAAEVNFSGKRCEVQGRGAVWEDSVLSITEPGVYSLSGKGSGLISVDCEGTVELVLHSLTLFGERCAVYSGEDSTLILTAEEGSQNRLTASDSAEDNSAVLYCDGSLVLTGTGTTDLEGAGNGIYCRGLIRLSAGNVTVRAEADGIRTKDSRSATADMTLSGGGLSVDAGEDALHIDGCFTMDDGTLALLAAEDAINAATVVLNGGGAALNAGDEGVDADVFTLAGSELGIEAEGNGISVTESADISSGTLNLTAALDGIQSEGDITLSGGEIQIYCAEGGGQAINVSDSGSNMGPGGWGGSSGSYTMPDYSCKALKADGNIQIINGRISLESTDDTIHAGGDVQIDGGELTVLSTDDGIHADGNMTINGGSILVEDCFEGLEAAIITINGGDTDVFSVNDGLNATSGSSGGFGFGGSSDCGLYMYGGTLDIVVTGSNSNLGDGVDSNGFIAIYGGTITSSTNGYSQENGLDSGGSFVVYGGTIAAAGNSGMQESASSSSTQCTAVLSLSDYVAGGTECVVADSSGREIFRWTPANQFNSLVLSHPEFQIGETYTVTMGNSTTEFTFTSTSYSNGGGGFGGGFGGGGFPF